ncbi:MAG: GNAT family N-acetyltransferase [Methanoregula sp.]|jgi:hypothetical protein|nr:GNAT family N-acetyltransferase [Methanoregula sp.]
MPEFNVRILPEPEYDQWDHLVEKSVQGTVFHLSSWITTAAKILQVCPVIIGVNSTAGLIGGCSFYLNALYHFYKKGTTEVTLIPYGGFVIENPKSTQVRECETREHKIISLILEKIQTLNLSNVTLTNGPGLVDMRSFTGKGWEETIKYCYVFPLSCNIEEHISKKTRWSIHKAKKAGIVVRQKWDKELYWYLTINTYHKQGKQPPYSRELLFSFLENVENTRCGEMWIAETASGEGAAAEILVWDPHMAYRWLAASDIRYKDTEAPTLLLFEVMKHVQEKGFVKFNMMGANTPQFAKFISSFNPSLVPYYSVQKIRGIYRIPGMIRSLITRR